jgi:hypothetical protein
MRVCVFCRQELPDTLEVYRNTLCPRCTRELKVCRHCEFYSPGAHWDCRESIPEAVRDKERANFCDYFRYRQSGAGADNPARKKTASSQDQFKRLFGD